MGISFGDMDQSRQFIRAKLDSKEWWMFIVLSLSTNQIVTTIEQTYYTDEASSDFDLILIPPDGLGVMHPFLAIYLAKKDHMTVQQLIQIMQSYGSEITRGQLQRRDVLCLGNEEHRAQSFSLMRLLNDWLYVQPERN